MKFGAQLVLPFSTKRQCAIQPTIVAKGCAHIPRLVIFRGKLKRIKQEERCKWDNRVQTVKCQDKAWCDEHTIKDRISEQCGNTQ